jgi:hypothetical protein
MNSPAVSFDHANDPARPGHNTALYDPAAHDDQIVAMFETPADAQAALDRLAAEGVAGDAEITDRTADGANAGVNSEGGNTGLWGSLKGLFAPDDEVHGLAEGVRRGHALLVLHPSLEHRGRVIELLEASGPIDFDARLEQWRTAGWENLRAQEAATMGAAAGNGVPEEPARDRIGVRDTTRGGERVRSYFAARSTSET